MTGTYKRYEIKIGNSYHKVIEYITKKKFKIKPKIWKDENM